MKKRKEPSKKTSIYLSEQNIEIIRGIQEKKAYVMQQMLKKSKVRHERSIKVIEEDLEKKVWAATRNRQRQEEALKSYKLQ